MEKEFKKGILYLCVHKMLEERINMSRIYPKKDFFRMLGETFHVPKAVRVCVMKEMIKKGLIKDLGSRRNHNILVLKVDIDMENDVNELYKIAGVY